jgi:hypothetical protein
MALTQVTFSMIDGASINVQDYGAKGDGVAIDTAAIASALSAALSSGKALYFPTGRYLIDDEFAVNTGAFNSLKIYGELPRSINATGVRISQTNTAKNVFVFGTPSTSFTDLLIENIEFYGPNSGTGSGLVFNKTSTAKIVNCGFWVFGYYGIHLAGTITDPNYDIEIVNCRFTQNNTVGLYSDTNAVNILTVDGCNFQNDDRTENKHGIQVSGFVINIVNNTIQTLSDGIRIDEGYNINIENNYMENFDGYMLRLGYTGDVYGLKLSGNHMYNGASAGNHLVFMQGNDLYGAQLFLNTMWAGTGKKKYNFSNAVVFSNVAVLPSRQDDPSADYSWPSGLYPSYIGDFFSPKVTNKSLSADLSITQSDGNCFYLDPNGANRNITFSGNFPVGYTIKLLNTNASTYKLIVTSFSNYEIPKQTVAVFEYTSGGWALSSIVGRETNTSISSGTLTIKSLSANSADMTGFIQIQPGVWVPYTTDPSP